MINNADNYKSSVIPVLSLLFTLCICAAMVISSGALTYKSTVSQMGKNYALYTSVQYIQEKFRQNDCIASVEIIKDNETDILVLKDKENNVCTYIYCYDGWLMELFTVMDTEPVLSAGQKLTNLTSMKVEDDNGLYRIFVRDNEGNSSSVVFSMISGGDNE